jgi:hypothetical protein
MQVLKLKRTKVSTILSTIDPALSASLEDQNKAVQNWTTRIPKVIVIGPSAPTAKADGLSHIQTGPTPAMVNLLATYMKRIPGAEICMLAGPDVLITGEIEPLLKHVDTLRLDIAWGCNLSINGVPKAFVLSSPVVVHLMNDLNPMMNFTHDWRTVVHSWMQKLLRQRYFDGSQFNIISPLPFGEVSDSVVDPVVDPVAENKGVGLELPEATPPPAETGKGPLQPTLILDPKLTTQAPVESLVMPRRPTRGNVRKIKI